MKSFAEFVQEKKVQRMSPNPAEARSLLEQSESRFSDLLKLPLDETNASFRFEHAYEALRESTQAFLAFSGYKPYSHEAVFVFGFERGLFSEAEFHHADRYREIRNDINYRGRKVIIEETKEIISFVKSALPQLKKKFVQWAKHKE